MARSIWTFQSAQARFNAVVRAARRQPQIVIRRGRPAFVVLSPEEYARLRRLEQTRTPSFAELLLAIPQDGGEFERLDGELREVDF